ncbi:Immunity/modification protein [Streptococcus sp. DD10]|uniref:LPXTG cell wall anchor domain-containing protein n=1 Tax=Streptococcus sp. DD10 TaxID=1777878 RepID=UPI000793E38D|nr:LPXTG cell wall anchor domain-containing protein [Streptococcus sp. DD10]KXT74287.1 Immunity/modification protein [Streptococcus sp. DD10]
MKKYLYLLSTASLLAFSTGTALADETVNSPETVQTEPTESTTTETDTNVETPAPQPAEEEHQDITIEDYEKNVADLQQVDIQTVYNMFSEDAKGETTLYVGRPTCIHCRLFSPTLKELNNLIDSKLNYYNIDSEDFDQKAKDFLFKTVGIPGTPTTLYLVDGKLQAGWVGGDTTAEELYKNLYKKDYVPKTSEIEAPTTTTEVPTRPVLTEVKTKPVKAEKTENVTAVQTLTVTKQNATPTQTSAKNTNKTLPNTGDSSSFVTTLIGLLSLSTAGIVFKKKY